MNALTKAKNIMCNLLYTRSLNMSKAETLDALQKGIELGYNTAYDIGYAQGKTDGINEAKTPISKPNFIKELEDSNTPTLKKKLDEALKLWTEDKPEPFKKKEPQPQGMPAPTPKKRGRPAKPKGE